MLFEKKYDKLSEKKKKKFNDEVNRNFIKNSSLTKKNNKIIIGGNGFGKNIKIKTEDIVQETE